GYATTTLGLLGTSWAGGFVIGCLVAPKIVRRVVHVRAFSGFISIIAIIALRLSLLARSFRQLSMIIDVPAVEKPVTARRTTHQ
ncbi:hypothetical protein ACC685_37855, partial [Rhizobium ruizarguesonis]